MKWNSLKAILLTRIKGFFKHSTKPVTVTIKSLGPLSYEEIRASLNPEEQEIFDIQMEQEEAEYEEMFERELLAWKEECDEYDASFHENDINEYEYESDMDMGGMDYD